MISLAAFFLIQSLQVEVTKQGSPVPHQEVELFVFKKDEGPEIYSKKKTNSKGIVKFETPKAEASYVAVRAFFGGLSYFSAPLQPPGKVALEVYDSRPWDDQVTLADLKTFVDFQGENLFVEQEIVIENSSAFALIGKDAEKMGKEVFRFSVPSTAFNLKLNLGFSQQESQFEGYEVLSSKPLLPGLNRFSWSYTIEKPGLSFKNIQKFSLPVERLSLSLGYESLKVNFKDLKPKAYKYYGERWMPTFEAMPKTSDIVLEITGIPLQWRWSEALPLVSFFILLFSSLIFSRLKEKITPHAPKEPKLRELLSLKRLREVGLLSERDYQNQRLKIIEDLAPFYLNKEKG